MPRYTADECASIVPGHLPSPFRRSFDAELLAVPAPERGLAAAASSSSTLGTGCSPWSTGWLPLLSLSPCRRCAEPPPIDCWHCPVHQRQPCTPLVARDVLGLLVVSSRRRAELPLAVGVGPPELALRLACLGVNMLDSFQLGWTHRPHRERSAGHTESAVGGEIAAICRLHPKLGRNAAVWGGFNEINKLTRQAAPAPEARGGQRLTKDQFVIAQPGPLTGGCYNNLNAGTHSGTPWRLNAGAGSAIPRFVS